MLRFIRSRLVKEDEGIALVMVIAIGTVLSILVVSAIAFSISGLKSSRTTQDWDGALAAAYAGVEEYQSRLAADPAYWKNGNPAAPFSSTSAVTMPIVDNPAFGSGSGTGITRAWATVAGTSATAPARFRYEVDNSAYAGTGVIRIRATGVVGNATRTIVADLKQKGFLDFLYFTDYEISDPQITGSSCVPAYAWAVSSRPNCSPIQFGAFDTLNGPVHSNDTMYICGATFTGKVTTGNTGSPNYTKPSACSSATFSGGPITYSPVEGMPSTNSELKKETRSDTGSGVPAGCLYTGPTSITFTSNGYMTVRSPWTKLTNIQGDPATSGSVSADCGTPGASGLGSASGQSVKVPNNRVIFVQNIPASTGPNYASSASTGSGVACLSPSGSTVTGNGLGYPATNEQPPSTSTANPSYGCRNGDVFVKGTLSGQVTVAAENFVYAVDNIVYNNSQQDMLGLVGQNSVWVWNPVKSDNTNLYAAANRRIDSALLSVAHTVQVQNFSLGNVRGTLTVNGAIAQRFRGPVATASGGTIVTGFAKNYLYDTRFRYAAPPKFLSPVTTTYGVTVWVETAAAYKPDGSIA